MQRKVIAIDMDDTLAGFLEGLVEVVNRLEGENVKVEDIKSWDMYKYFKCGHKIYSYLTYDLFRNLRVFDDAIEVVKSLQENYDVYIVSSATSTSDSMVAKIEWLEEWFPFIDKKNIVLCGDKSIIKADYMIDDGVHNLKTFDGMGLLFNAPHNQEEKGFSRFNNWEHIRRYFKLLGGL